MSEDFRRLEAILRATPRLMQVLETARALDLPDWIPVVREVTGEKAYTNAALARG